MSTMNSIFNYLLIVLLLSSCSSHIDEEYKEQDGDSTVKITSEIIERSEANTSEL